MCKVKSLVNPAKEIQYFPSRKIRTRKIWEICCSSSDHEVPIMSCELKLWVFSSGSEICRTSKNTVTSTDDPLSVGGNINFAYSWASNISKKFCSIRALCSSLEHKLSRISRTSNLRCIATGQRLVSNAVCQNESSARTKLHICTFLNDIVFTLTTESF